MVLLQLYIFTADKVSVWFVVNGWNIIDFIIVIRMFDDL